MVGKDSDRTRSYNAYKVIPSPYLHLQESNFHIPESTLSLRHTYIHSNIHYSIKNCFQL